MSERLGDFLEKLEAEETRNDLTFIDDVLVTWEIFNRILDKRLRNEKREPEKDENDCTYLDIINDDVTDLLLNNLLEKSYFKLRKKELAYLFEV